MTRDEIIQECRDIFSGEDHHAWENFMWILMDLRKSDEFEDSVPFSKRPEEE